MLVPHQTLPVDHDSGAGNVRRPSFQALAFFKMS